jgi:hypothetical protein
MSNGFSIAFERRPSVTQSFLGQRLPCFDLPNAGQSGTTSPRRASKAVTKPMSLAGRIRERRQRHRQSNGQLAASVRQACSPRQKLLIDAGLARDSTC